MRRMSLANSLAVGLFVAPLSMLAAVTIGDSIESAHTKPFAEGGFSHHNGIDGQSVDYRETDPLGFTRVAMRIHLEGAQILTVTTSNPRLLNIADRYVEEHCAVIEGRNDGDLYVVESSLCVTAPFSRR